MSAHQDRQRRFPLLAPIMLVVFVSVVGAVVVGLHLRAEWRKTHLQNAAHQLRHSEGGASNTPHGNHYELAELPWNANSLVGPIDVMRPQWNGAGVCLPTVRLGVPKATVSSDRAVVSNQFALRHCFDATQQRSASEGGEEVP